VSEVPHDSLGAMRCALWAAWGVPTCGRSAATVSACCERKNNADFSRRPKSSGECRLRGETSCSAQSLLRPYWELPLCYSRKTVLMLKRSGGAPSHQLAPSAHTTHVKSVLEASEVSAELAVGSSDSLRSSVFRRCSSAHCETVSDGPGAAPLAPDFVHPCGDVVTGY